MKFRRFALGLAACLLLTAAAVQGAVVHDNGAFGAPAGSLGGRLIADDFTFLAPTSFNTVRFWAGGNAGVALDYDGTITWQIRDNGASGHPGNLLASGTASPLAQFVSTDEYDTYLFEFAIPTVTVSGTNFLVLHEGLLSDFAFNNFYWNDVPGAANPNAEDITDLQLPEALRTDYAFQLLQVEAVPEPVGAAIFGAGLVAAAALRRRKTRA
jgi:hypothetical protein